MVEVGEMPATRVSSSARQAWPVCPPCQTWPRALAHRGRLVYNPRAMPPGRAERPFLSFLCGVTIATASLPVGAAVAPASATPPVAAPVEPASTPAPAIDPAATPGAATDAATTTEPATTPATTTEPATTPAPATSPAPATTGTGKSATPPPAKPPAPADDEASELPQRLTPLQTAGWWTLFGGVAIGTLAGVMAGLAERQEDRALRLSVRFDLDTGAQPRFADVQGEYESTLRKGRAQANAGIALAVIGLAAAAAGIAVLGVAGVRQRKAAGRKDAARLQWRGGGMQVRF